MKKMMGLFVLAALMPLTAFGLEIPDGDPMAILQAVISLLDNWSVIAPLAKASMVTVILAQAFKLIFPGFKYKLPVVAILSVINAVLLQLQAGASLVPSLVTVLFVMGGAVLIYESLKKPVVKLADVAKQRLPVKP